jgi:hypothetical protein
VVLTLDNSPEIAGGSPVARGRSKVITLTRACYVGGDALAPGSVIKLDRNDALSIIQSGKAEEHDNPEKAKLNKIPLEAKKEAPAKADK